MANSIPRPHFDLPIPSSAAESLARLRADQELDVGEVAQTARQVPALQTLLLRAANAASNGLQHSIDTPEHAIAILGSVKLKAIVHKFHQQHESRTPPAK